MDESEDTMSSDDSKNVNNSSAVKKPKKRSLVERELETNLTARVTSPVTNGDASSTSRYGRSRRLKTDSDFCDPDKAITKALKSPSFDKTPIKVQSPVYRMHASNSPSRTESPKIVSLDSKIEHQIENIYNANISLSRFSTEEKNQSPSPVKKFPKVYIRKDLIQSKEKEETVTLIKNMFSPVKSCKPANSHLSNILERSSEKYTLNGNIKQNGYLDTSSVVKTLDFDGKKKRKEMKDGKTLSKSELFDIEAKCAYQVGDLAWARMGTYPFWPCIVTREPGSELFVKKKLFGRIERDIIHVTFFGDNGRRSWVVDTMLRKFLGLQEFEATRDQFTPEDKKKDPRLYAAFFISEKKITLWKASVEEADTLLREPKRLRIDLLIDLLEKSRGTKVVPKQQKQQKVRSDNDVPLSESLYDTLFSEDDAKPDDSERSRNKTRNKSLDVSEVVTACLDNMAAKTGMIKIQKQSHMDRWLQKAKSKTPEKLKVVTTLDTLEKDTKDKKDKAKGKEKESKTVESKKKKITKETPTQKPYHFRRSVNESQHLLSHHNEHDYSIKSYEGMEKCFVKIDKTDIAKEKLRMQKTAASKNSEELCVVVKVETLSDKSEEEENNDNKVISCRNDSDESIDTVPDKVIAQKSNEAIERKTEINSTEMEVDPPTQVDENLHESTKVFLEETIEVNDKIDNPNEIKMMQDNIIEITEVNDTINLQSTIEIIEDSDITLPTCDLQDSLIQNGEESIIPAGINAQPDESIESGLQDQNTSIQGDNDKSNNLSVLNIDCVVTTNINEETDVEASDVSSKAGVNDVISEDKDGVTVDEGEEITKSNSGIGNTEDIIKIGSIECVIEHITSDGEDSASDRTRKENKKANDTMAVNKQIEIVKENLQSDSEKTENLLNNIDSKEMNTVSVLKNDEDILKPEDNIPELILNAEVPIAKPNEKTVVANDKKLENASDIVTENNEEPMSVNEKVNFTNDNVNDIDSEENYIQAKSFEIISKPNEKTVVVVENAADAETENSEKLMPVNENVSLTNDNVNDIDSEENAIQAKSFTMITKSNEKTVVAGGEEPENAADIQTENSEKSMPVNENVSLTNDNVNDINSEENDIQAKSFTMVAKSNEKAVVAGGKEPDNAADIETENIEKSMPVNENVSLTNDSVNDIDSKENNIQAKSFEIVSTSVEPVEDVLVTGHREVGPEIVHTTIEANEKNVTELMLISHEKSTDNAIISSKKDLDNDNVNGISIICPMQSVEDILVSQKQDIGEETLPEIASVDSTENATVSVEEDTNHNNLSKITSDSITQSSKDAVSTKENKNEIDKMLDITETNEILENGIYDDELPNLKFDNYLESETESINSELDDISLSELKLRSKQVNCDTENVKMGTKDPQNEMPIIELDSQIDTVETNLPKIVKVKTENTEVSILDTKFENPRRSRFSLRKSELQKDKGNDKHVKEDSPQRKDEEECDPDTISIKSEDSTASTKRKRKEKAGKVDNLKDPEFLRYLELRQDVLIEEHPELTIDEIIAYLFKTWLYENSMKSDQKKSDDIEQSNLVKGQGPSKPIKQKKNKAININKVLSQEVKKSVVSKESKDKPKRKTSQPYYNEEFSDIEDEIQMFEIFNSKSKDHVPKAESTLQATEIKTEPKDDPKIDTQLLKKEISEPETIDLDEYDEVEAYFEELTKPKPNIFKGLVREKVCEICERTNNLIKCKGCHGMFHADCVRKQKEIVEVPLPTKGRKKKKKPRGRKPKVSTDSNGVDSESQSDEKSQDLSEDFSVSLEEIESERIVTDADLFEAQFSTKMNEILETAEKIDYDSYSTDEELDWKGVKAGKCKIVDIRLKPRSKPIELDFKCHNCLKYDQPICFVCKSIVSPKTQNLQKQKCQIAHCYKYYHLECLEQWPQTQFNSGEPSRNNKKISEFFEAMSCPRHVCHTCVSDDPRGCKTRFSGDKLARCVKCPATYHSFTKCLPAGSQILTASQIICPRHYEHRPGKVPCHVNTGWCFICALGGSLICCEYCPTSFHAECLNIKPPEGGYMCEDCETGRLPLYGEIVWVKLGHYRWWPGIILHPFEIPENIMAVKHSFGEFVVRFFGQYDHYWVNRGRVFPFQEGDSGKVSGQKSKIDEAFTIAMEHAQRAFTLMNSVPPNEEESLDIASSLLPPHYVKLKVNKPCGSLCGRRVDVEESSLTQCECNPEEEEPCGLYSHCLNRMLLTECGPTCRAGDRCNNRAFEKRQYPKLVPYRTPHRGWGLKTLEDIKAGQFVIEYVGELIDEEEFQRRMRRKHEIRDENFYFLTLDKERMIDAGPKGNSARFMNHCCEPNCETQKWTVLGDVRVGLFAINDIPADSEVTFNYNLECAGIEKKRCLCGAKRCSGYIGAKPKQDEPQSKKNKIALKRTYKKRKNIEESPSTSKMKPKRPVGRPAKPRELTEIEKDLLIIKNATNGLSSDSECSRLSSLEGEGKGLKRKRVSFSEDRSSSPSVKRLKIDEGRSEVGD